MIVDQPNDKILKIMKFKILLTCVVCLISAKIHADPLGTAFTYQGQLATNGVSANGTYDFLFKLYTNSATGSLLTYVTVTNVAVTNGIFTTTMDFGAMFNGTAYWLGISVRSNNSGSYVALTPRQALTPTPNALYSTTSGTAATASSVSSGSVTAAGIANATITAANIASGQVVTSLNGLKDAVTLLQGNNVTITPSGNTLTIAASGGTSGWSLNGNSGTTPGGNYVGTADNQPLELHVNGMRALRLEPTGTNGSVNVIGGSSGNQVKTGIVGATIAGGGTLDYHGDAHTNSVEADFGTIGGGRQNTIQAGSFDSVIAGGRFNTISNSDHATISGGDMNVIQDGNYVATIGGGAQNTIQSGAYDATISGGSGNIISSGAKWATTGGGSWNTNGGQYATLAGGRYNANVSPAYAPTIGGGYGNVNAGSYSTIGGGNDNTIDSTAQFSTVPGGRDNYVVGSGSLAAGSGGSALHSGCFVWCDHSGYGTQSTSANQFMVRCAGGAFFYTAAGTSTGVQLASGGGSWSSLSDRDAKENFTSVDAKVVLEKVAQMPLSTWNYKSQDQSTRHIGPMAQDFYAAFGVGEDERHITTVDEGGVALAAIQGLNLKLEEKESRIQEQAAEIQALKQDLAELKKLVQTIAEKK
jgi:hypothetical protein